MGISKLEYHDLIAPFANSFASIIAGFLGWRLIDIDYFNLLLEKQGGTDRVALASLALHESKENVTFSFRNSITPLITGDSDHHRLLSVPAQQLLGHCWEILRTEGLVPRSMEPVLEFYRHIRNGCFHGNSFHFLGDQPKNKAEWRGLVITRNLHGQRILRSDLNESEFFLNWGDPLLLLSDVSRIIN